MRAHACVYFSRIGGTHGTSSSFLSLSPLNPTVKRPVPHIHAYRRWRAGRAIAGTTSRPVVHNLELNRFFPECARTVSCFHRRYVEAEAFILYAVHPGERTSDYERTPTASDHGQRSRRSSTNPSPSCDRPPRRRRGPPSPTCLNCRRHSQPDSTTGAALTRPPRTEGGADAGHRAAARPRNGFDHLASRGFDLAPGKPQLSRLGLPNSECRKPSSLSDSFRARARDTIALQVVPASATAMPWTSYGDVTPHSR
jgi:hypothetical protein